MTWESFAAWSDVSLGISPISINSLRKYAELHFKGGVNELVRLMRASRFKQSVKRTRSSKSLSADKEAALADAIFSYGLRYGDLLDRVRSLALHDLAIRHELSAHTAKYGWIGGFVPDRRRQ